MITDALLQFSAAQAVTATAVSTNTIDLGVTRDAGPGDDITVGFTVDTTVTAAGAATVNFQLVTSAAANLSSPNVLTSTGPIGKAELVAGRKAFRLRLSPHVLNALPLGQRYLGMQYVVGTGPLTAGAFSAGVLENGQDTGIHYGPGFTVF